MSSHFTLILDEAGTAWLTFDMADSPVNVLSQETLDALGEQIGVVEEQGAKALVIRSAKRGGFIAGANVKAFAGQDDADQVRAMIVDVHQLFERIERLPMPTVALIDGHCLGGGLELALACDYRVACDDPATRIGFPEVRLGIFPGFGGSVRALRVLGDVQALQVMLGGRTFSARAARNVGLVDRAVPRRQLDNTVAALLRDRPPLRQAGTIERLPSLPPVRPLLAWWLHRSVEKRAPRKHYPAPHALIDHWAKHARDEAALYRSEADRVSRLLVGDTAQNLIRVFLLQEQLKGLAQRGDGAPIKRVHVIGAGVMGGDIAAWCALRGLQVTLQDMSLEQLGRAMSRAGRLFKDKLKDRYAVQQAKDRLIADPAGHAVPQADLVLEAIVERADAKQGLFRDLEPRMKPDAVLATNTSSIPLEVLAEALVDPGRLVGLHFFNPVAKMQLVEVVTHPRLDEQVKARALGLVKAIGKLPLPVRSAPGFLVNRVLMPYLMEAVALLQEGVPAVLVDRAAVDFGMPMGPIELADTVGLDICQFVAEELAEQLHSEVPPVLREHVAAGHLGRKSGEGFYVWHNGKPKKPSPPRGYMAPHDLADRMMLRMINEAVGCLREEVVASADRLDAGVVYGTGFAPFRGGPMHYVQSQGAKVLENKLASLAQRHGDRFIADPGWGQSV